MNTDHRIIDLEERRRRRLHATALLATEQAVDDHAISREGAARRLRELCGMDHAEAHRYAAMLFDTRARATGHRSERQA